jgi:hypothetical protein
VTTTTRTTACVAFFAANSRHPGKYRTDGQGRSDGSGPERRAAAVAPADRAPARPGSPARPLQRPPLPVRHRPAGTGHGVGYFPKTRDDPNRLRDQATHLLALALVSRKQGQVEYSDQLTQLASELLLRAEEIERAIGNIRAAD